jgi:hypothetical protein
MLITMRRRQKKESDYDYQTISMVTYWMNRKLQQKKERGHYHSLMFPPKKQRYIQL